MWDGVLVKDSLWAYPEDSSVRMNLTKMYEEHDHYKKRAKVLQKWIRKEFTEKKKYQEYVSLLEEYTQSFEQEVEEIENLFNEFSVGE